MKKLLALLLLLPVVAGAEPAGGPWVEFDTNEDGQVTREEFMDRAATRFDQLDEDDNDVLTHSDLEAHRQQKMESQQE